MTADERLALINTKSVARLERHAAVSAPRPAASAPPERMVSPERTAAIFWPDAAADLVEYVFFPKPLLGARL